MRIRRRSGYSLVEVLVVIAILAILMSLLLPAIQAARESARRAQCGNHLRQMGLAMQQYHDAKRRFPSGTVSSSRLLWTGSILPFIEQQNLHNQIDFSLPWNLGNNARVCSTFLPIYRCPSSTSPDTMTAQGIDDRVPCDYLAVCSGTDMRESGLGILAGGPHSNGVFFVDSRVRMAEIVDGTSNTVAVGDSFFQFEELELDHTGYPQFLDRWCVGTLEGIGNEVSEAIGSTGVAINSHKLEVFIDEKELAFGSQHPGGVQMVSVDGAVRLFSAEVDRSVWSALGTIKAGDRVDER
jgi:prepilin-type N-terminal cleavage/methylation domain-containing protein